MKGVFFDFLSVPPRVMFEDGTWVETSAVVAVCEAIEALTTEPTWPPYDSEGRYIEAES